MRIASLLLLALFFTGSAYSQTKEINWEDPDAQPWKESSYKLPPFPEDKNLVEFYVSAAATAKYYIDKTSIDAGHDDNVVRYTLVVKTEGGAVNTSYEGLRCGESELRVYATGRADGTWKEVPGSQWKPLRTLNRHQYALARFYFCPVGVAIWSAEEGRDALRLGANPKAPRYDSEAPL